MTDEARRKFEVRAFHLVGAFFFFFFPFISDDLVSPAPLNTFRNYIVRGQKSMEQLKKNRTFPGYLKACETRLPDSQTSERLRQGLIKC